VPAEVPVVLQTEHVAGRASVRPELHLPLFGRQLSPLTVATHDDFAPSDHAVPGAHNPRQKIRPLCMR
jgi:hypothetical protein